MYYALGLLQEVDKKGKRLQEGHAWWIVLSGPHPTLDSAAIGLSRAVLARSDAERRSSYKLIEFALVDGYDLPDYGLPINNLHMVQAELPTEGE